MSNLSGLPHDLLVTIAKKLNKLEEYVSFKCVSKYLFAAAKDEYFEGLRLRQQTPYLMLPIKDGNDDVRELYSLVEGESVMASVRAANFNTKKCLESLGWLLVCQEDGNMSLLEPFSGTEIPLPHQSTFPGRMELMWMLPHVFIHKMVLSSRPDEARDFILMVIYGGGDQLAFWRLGDKAWSGIDEYKHFVDVVYHSSETFYAVAEPGKIYIIKFARNDCDPECDLIMGFKDIVPDLESMDPPHIKHPMDHYAFGFTNFYILKSEDIGLLIIIRIAQNLCEDGSAYVTSKFLVFEVDVMMKSCKEIYSLGGVAVFLGHNSTIAVDANSLKGGVIKPNCIYFTEDEYEYYFFESAKGGGKDMGIYNMESRTVEPIDPGKSVQSKVSTPMWFNPCI